MAADAITIVKNDSGEDITLRFYPDGKVRENVEDILIKKDSIFSYRNGSLLPNLIPSFYMLDSMTVNFGSNKKVTHFARGKDGNSISALQFDHPRNLLNEYNYRKDVITDKKCSYFAEYHYTFTTEDVR